MKKTHTHTFSHNFKTLDRDGQTQWDKNWESPELRKEIEGGKNNTFKIKSKLQIPQREKNDTFKIKSKLPIPRRERNANRP